MTTTDRPLTWGVLSTAKIGRMQVVPGMRKTASATVLAISSRDAEKARATAADLGIPRAYGSYEAMLADPEIEAVYNPLPNHLHVPLTVAAMEAGKHVLCEKPIALTATEAALLVEAERRTGRRVAEAFMVRHHPQWARVRELLRAGRIGTVQTVQAFFSYRNVNPGDIRNMADIGGGGLYDIGCYAIAAARFVFEADPVRAVALIDRDPVMGTDRLASGLLDFGGGRQTTFTVGTQSVKHQRVQIVGTEGRIEVEVPFNPLPTRPTRILIADGGEIGGGPTVEETFAPVDQYMLQADAFARAIRTGAPFAHPIGDAVAQMRVIDALFRSGDSGRWETV